MNHIPFFVLATLFFLPLAFAGDASLKQDTVSTPSEKIDSLPKEASPSIVLNVHSGSILELSDGRIYEIAPDDRFYAAYWLTPFNLKVLPNQDPEYSWNLTNLNTGTTVRGKEISKQQLLAPEPSEQPPDQTAPAAPLEKQQQAPNDTQEKQNPQQPKTLSK